MTKKEVLEQAARGEGCLGKAGDDEPVFILRAQDALAAGLIEAWAEEAEARGCPSSKVQGALLIAAAMRRFPNRKWPD